uniref:LYR motif containing 1 n=2 Tax=Phasianus colchicus TaxID=9054 RepID=A0A669PS21_PHACC
LPAGPGGEHRPRNRETPRRQGAAATAEGPPRGRARVPPRPVLSPRGRAAPRVTHRRDPGQPAELRITSGGERSAGAVTSHGAPGAARTVRAGAPPTASGAAEEDRRGKPSRGARAESAAWRSFCQKMTAVTRQEVLGLYRRVFRIAKKWQSASGQAEETAAEREYIIKEAKTLFRKNKEVTDPKLIKQYTEECEARIEIGLHYNIPYPRPIHLPPMGLTQKQGRTFRHQEKLRKISKPIYLKSHDEIS